MQMMDMKDKLIEQIEGTCTTCVFSDHAIYDEEGWTFECRKHRDIVVPEHTCEQHIVFLGEAE